MGSPALIDTNILIDFLAGSPLAELELARYGDRAVSVITRIELLAEGSDSDRAKAERFLERFLLLELTPQIVEQTIKVRRTTRLKLPDAVLLATAQVEKRVLITRNTRDFVAGKHVRVPYQL